MLKYPPTPRTEDQQTNSSPQDYVQMKLDQRWELIANFCKFQHDQVTRICIKY